MGGLSTKIHATVDALGNPTSFALTPGQKNDLGGADLLLPDLKAGAVLADKAYDSKENHKILKEKGISNGILIKGTRKRALTAVEKRCNRILSKLRSPVERVFGTLKRSYRYCRAKYLGLRKNKLQLTMTCIAYNLRRMEKLCA